MKTKNTSRQTRRVYNACLEFIKQADNGRRVNRKILFTAGMITPLSELHRSVNGLISSLTKTSKP